MPIPAGRPTTTAEKHGVGAAAKQVAEHASSLARLELELAGVELKHKVGALGAGAGLGIAAALLGLFGLGFLFATIAVVLAIVLDAWLARRARRRGTRSREQSREPPGDRSSAPVAQRTRRLSRTRSPSRARHSASARS